MKIILDLKFDNSRTTPNDNFPIAKLELNNDSRYIGFKLSDSERVVAVSKEELLKALTALS